jgi:serine/threonine protein kinase
MGPGTGGPISLIGRDIAGYRLERGLGVGLTGAVYLGQPIAGSGESDATADGPQKRGEVAIKILLPSWEISADEQKKADFDHRFDREVRTLKRLQHPNIVSVLDFGETKEDHLTYMVMPYLSGGTLGERMAVGQLPFADADRWIQQLASALDYAHGEGVVHRDIKPQNVMLDSEGNAHLADFSIVRLMDDARTKQTTEGRLLGTPAYMAPEQVRSGKVSAASDIYSLGVLCFAMVAGQAPFEGESDSVAELLLKVIQDPPPRPRSLRPDLPEPAEEVIWQALSKQPDQRFASASAFAEAFTAGLQGKQLPYVRPIPPVIQESSEPDWKTTTVSQQSPLPTVSQKSLLPPPKRRILVPALLGAVVLLLISTLVLAHNGLGGLLTPSSNPGTPNIGQGSSTGTTGNSTHAPTATPKRHTSSGGSGSSGGTGSKPAATHTPTPRPTIPPTVTPRPPTPTPTKTPVVKSISISWSSAHPTWIRMTWYNFPTGGYTYTCNFSTPPQSNSFHITETTSPQTWDSANTCYDSQHGDHVWVTVNGVSSNTLTVP